MSEQKGKAQPHYNYIMAEGRYTKKADEIEYKESGNLPRWARDNPAELWQCADLFERKMARLTVNILSVYRVS